MDAINANHGLVTPTRDNVWLFSVVKRFLLFTGFSLSLLDFVFVVFLYICMLRNNSIVFL